jgi:hypothetical protein
MLEFDINTIASMTAALEQASRHLKNDNREARKFIADRLARSARGGGTSLAALSAAALAAVAELNSGKTAPRAKSWTPWSLLQW